MPCTVRFWFRVMLESGDFEFPCSWVNIAGNRLQPSSRDQRRGLERLLKRQIERKVIYTSACFCDVMHVNVHHGSRFCRVSAARTKWLPQVSTSFVKPLLCVAVFPETVLKQQKEGFKRIRGGSFNLGFISSNCGAISTARLQLQALCTRAPLSKQTASESVA